MVFKTTIASYKQRREVPPCLTTAPGLLWDGEAPAGATAFREAFWSLLPQSSSCHADGHALLLLAQPPAERSKGEIGWHRQGIQTWAQKNCTCKTQPSSCNTTISTLGSNSCTRRHSGACSSLWSHTVHSGQLGAHHTAWPCCSSQPIELQHLLPSACLVCLDQK